MRDSVKKLESVAQEWGYTFSEDDFTTDKKTLNVRLGKDNNVFHILFIAEGDHYLAYDLSSDYLPRELYPDAPKEGFTPQQRNQEILANVAKILSKQLVFQPEPSFFYKERGYFSMPIDGFATKVSQNKNYFQLPVASE